MGSNLLTENDVREQIKKASRHAYHDDDGPVLVVEGLVARERGDDGEPLLRQEVALALVQPGPVRPTVLQPASIIHMESSTSTKTESVLPRTEQSNNG